MPFWLIEKTLVKSDRRLAQTCFPCTTTGSAAPRFVGFEAWVSLVPASGDFPDSQLRLLRFVHYDETGPVENRGEVLGR